MAPTKIGSITTYFTASGTSAPQGELSLNALPAYTAALRDQRVIEASCVLSDPRTCEMAQSYLLPQDVRSMLDAQIHAGENLAGVLCVESIGLKRVWRADEAAFVASAAGVLGQMYLAGELRRERASLEQRVQDRTADLVAARQAAEGANKSKSQFLATMSHELRTPLNAIIGYSELMRDAALANQRTGDIADHNRVLAAANRLLHLINEALDLAKIEASRLVLKLADIDIGALVEEVCDAVRPQLEANGNVVVVDIAANLPLARTDGFRLGQCLINLLSNAGKFTKNGRIRLAATAADGRVVFSVADTGIGIDAHKIAELFQPFVQADASTTREYGATGLGLVITRRIANLLGGDVTVTSELGAGSVFRLEISGAGEPLGAALAAEDAAPRSTIMVTRALHFVFKPIGVKKAEPSAWRIVAANDQSQPRRDHARQNLWARAALGVWR
jgi:signal transduction histidine kinase